MELRLQDSCIIYHDFLYKYLLLISSSLLIVFVNQIGCFLLFRMIGQWDILIWPMSLPSFHTHRWRHLWHRTFGAIGGDATDSAVPVVSVGIAGSNMTQAATLVIAEKRGAVIEVWNFSGFICSYVRIWKNLVVIHMFGFLGKVFMK